jgi:DNA-binding transcriptional ArsR family regulator
MLRAPIDKLAWLLVASDDSGQRELVRVTLSSLCRTLNASAATISLLDGTSIMLDATVDTRTTDDLRIEYAPRTDSPPGCPEDENRTCKGDFGDGLLCALGRNFETIGFGAQVCVALKLGATHVGRLLLLDEFPREFSTSELEYINSKGRQLILKLHHSFYFPEVCSEWTALEQSMSVTHKESMAHHVHPGKDSMAYQVLCSANLSHISSVATLTRSLPKGISWPTLRRICQYLDHVSAPVSRRDFSSAIGISDVTVGHYLKYLIDMGLVQRELSYGGMGRPAIMYRVSKRDDAVERFSSLI